MTSQVDDDETLRRETPFSGSEYHSPAFRAGLLARLFPALAFYGRMAAVVSRASRSATAGTYTDADWSNSSLAIAKALEATGGSLCIEGLDHFRNLDGPCLFVGNHMSTLETFLLPGIIRPFRPVTFVIKDSLQSYPVFGPIMRSRDPVVVGRSNPRQDLVAVLQGGQERLDKGISLVIFPQSTRMERFDPEQFNTIGVKLAKRAGVPVVPVALRTDFWGNGTLIKEFGPVRPHSPVHIRFGEPLTVQDTGKEEHAAIVAFIQASLAEWGHPAI